ncbi:hypothetical protein GIB67_009214 [Kingdonia uniflora]|uniref:Uncharacterized protein n=1 Tax=Kingdonia uniflora TaxID=39325 RepID=A0A7J7N2I2_9MAGN|nr:hypothetical protein GIB67_009214 [Kingdonia uniflora]
MGTKLFSFLQSLWPFSPYKQDLKLSTQLVSRLSLPDHTKQFVFAIPEPKSKSVIYILATQNLSERSALDAEYLIKGVRPDVVVAQVAPSGLVEIQCEERIGLRNGGGGNGGGNVVPTSAFGVIISSFVNKSNKDGYESLAGSLVLKEIFGVGFYGHFLATKRAANEVGSPVLLIESPNGKACVEEHEVNSEAVVGGSSFQNLGLKVSNFVPVGSVVSLNSRRFLLNRDFDSQKLKSLVSSVAQLTAKPGSCSSSQSSVSEVGLGDCQPRCNFQAPSFAESIYPLLTDLHDIFSDLPSIGRALGHAQKMLCNVERGEHVDSQLLSEVLTFRIAVEGLRVGLNSAGRCPMTKKMENKSGFSELSNEDKSKVLFAQALRSQTKKFKTVVAVVDASSLAGLREHWDTSVPPEVEDMIEQFLIEFEGEGQGEASIAKNTGRKSLIADKPVVAVGAGATAVIGVTSFSKLVPASTFVKLATYNVPLSLKLGLIHTQKAMTFAFAKVLGPSKVLGPGITTYGAKTSAVMKATASAEKIRAVAHSIIASAERTSFSAMRTAFYEIMRKRQVRPIGLTPWATLGCSIATCGGLLAFGDGIECAVESFPMAPKIASLGRGLQSLREASESARQTNSTKIQEAIQSLMYSLKKVKVQ